MKQKIKENLELKIDKCERILAKADQHFSFPETRDKLRRLKIEYTELTGIPYDEIESERRRHFEYLGNQRTKGYKKA